MGEELPADAVEEAVRLTRLARRAADGAPESPHGGDAPERSEAEVYRERREELLAEHGFVARVREDDRGATLVCYPAEWVEDGTVRTGAVEDTDRAVERDLTGGAGDPDEWDEVDAHNRALVDEIREQYGTEYAANASAFADFMGNHYARRVETATAPELLEFREEYYPRNAWPSDEQRTAVWRSLRYLLSVADDREP